MGRRVLHKWRRKQIGVRFYISTTWCIYPYHKVTHFIMYISIVRAHELNAFKGKRPQLFEGKIEPNDLCQGAVGDLKKTTDKTISKDNYNCGSK